jgi:TatD DNase family protein
MDWFDIGVNLTDKRLDTESVLIQAEKVGVNHMLVTGTTIEHSRSALKLAQQYPNKLYATAGIHPHYAKDAPENLTIQLTELLRLPEVLAIGECGLDFNRNFSSKDDQIKVFERQLELAEELQMPVFLHERDAFTQQIDILKSCNNVTGVAHSFTGTRQQMEAYLDLGLYIGITGWVCDVRRGKALRDALSHLPIERLLLETDAPYLKPHGIVTAEHHNIPANLPVIGHYVANLMKLSTYKVANASMENAKTLFMDNHCVAN